MNYRRDYIEIARYLRDRYGDAASEVVSECWALNLQSGSPERAEFWKEIGRILGEVKAGSA
jgi:hypothetical protein